MTARRKPLPSKLESPSESPGFLLWRVSNTWQRHQRAALKPLNLTHSQFVILASAVWYGDQEQLTQSRLAELSGVDVMTTSQIVRALIAEKLLERTEHPNDSRANAIAVTPTGRTKTKAAIKRVERVDEEFFAPIKQKQPELLALMRALANV